MTLSLSPPPPVKQTKLIIGQQHENYNGMNGNNVTAHDVQFDNYCLSDDALGLHNINTKLKICCLGNHSNA